MLTLVPNKINYSNKVEVIEAFERGDNFVILDLCSPHDGEMISCRELKNQQVRIYFNGLTESIVHQRMSL